MEDLWQASVLAESEAPVLGLGKSASKSIGSIGLRCSGPRGCWRAYIFKDIPYWSPSPDQFAHAWETRRWSRS
eukprot:7408419-Lingulodinium_polyedra.AAC.1